MLPTKVSVSEVKRKSHLENLMDEMGDYAVDAPFNFNDNEEVPSPSFIKEKESLVGAKRGTLIHSVFEHWDYLKIKEKEDIALEIDRLILERKLESEVKEVISMSHLVKMSQSEIVQKMRQSM